MYSFRWFQHAAQIFVKVPFFGAVSYLTVAVTPFCIVFAVLWGVYRHVSFAWIGQDILVRIVLLPLMCSFWWNLLLHSFLLIIFPTCSFDQYRNVQCNQELCPCCIWHNFLPRHWNVSGVKLKMLLNEYGLTVIEMLTRAYCSEFHKQSSGYKVINHDSRGKHLFNWLSEQQ